MSARLQLAMERMAEVANWARYLTRDEQEALAVRIESVADSLRWEQWFQLPNRFLTDYVISEASAEATSPQV